MSVFNDFFVIQQWFNGYREASRTVFHAAFFHHNITQDFPFDFLLFLKSKLKSQKWRKYAPLFSPDEILASVFTYTCSQLPELKTTQAENEI